MITKIKMATAAPLGVRLLSGGANVAVWSASATKIFFCTYDGKDVETSRAPLTQRAGDVHFDFVKGVHAGTRYGLRAEGPWMPEQGLLFDPAKVLLDPYAQQISGAFYYTHHLSEKGFDTALLVPKAIVPQSADDIVLRPVDEPQFIYELQVKSFTKLHLDVPEAQRGTVAALSHPSVISHLKSVGVDTVELMPVTAWIDERHLAALALSNAWGYNPVSFFAPDPRLAPGGLAEIRETVATLHDHGIQVILDLVFNHTGESDVFGPTVSFRGLDQPSYYRLYNGQLANDAGCGNTMALDRAHTVQLVIASLRHWVLKCGIDGFRFDLATIMGRRADGFDSYAPLLLAIESDPVLSTRIMIAEPWDVGPGGYQLGNFPPRWYEWNDRYRDDVRRFWRGDGHSANALATRVTGSSDFFQRKNRVTKSVNFLAAHDGFTLRDLTEYRVKYNFANGENNRDGKSDEITCVALDMRALLATLFFSRGVVMLTAGDEFGRTQLGNNNAYAQDNEITWLDWAGRDEALSGFVSEVIQLRKSLPILCDVHFLSAQTGVDDPVADWFGADGLAFHWQDAQARVLGLALTQKGQHVALVFNGGDKAEAFSYPAREGYFWQLVFSSAGKNSIAPHSVSIFEEKPLLR
jgi:glycogen debranching enzyme